jgi:hypothetical protein
VPAHPTSRSSTRRLDSIYPVIFIDAINVKVRGSGALCVIMGSACLVLPDRVTPEDHPM